MKSGSSVFTKSPSKSTIPVNPGNGGGNSGCVISPAPGLGLSAYQDPKVPVRKSLPKRQGGS